MSLFAGLSAVAFFRFHVCLSRQKRGVLGAVATKESTAVWFIWAYDSCLYGYNTHESTHGEDDGRMEFAKCTEWICDSPL
jgi:hypothetical protein